MIFEETTIESQRIYDGKILNLRRDKVNTVGGGTSYREIVEHRGGAVAAAITDDRRIILVRQFRKPMEAVILEAPAGKIEEGEDPLETISRELAEETGYTAGRIEFLSAIYPSVGYTNETLYLYLARDLTPGTPSFDEHEALDILEMELDEACRKVFDGEIQDAKTMLAILLAKNRILSEG